MIEENCNKLNIFVIFVMGGDVRQLLKAELGKRKKESKVNEKGNKKIRFEQDEAVMETEQAEMSLEEQVKMDQELAAFQAEIDAMDKKPEESAPKTSLMTEEDLIESQMELNNFDEEQLQISLAKTFRNLVEKRKTIRSSSASRPRPKFSSDESEIDTDN
jgi:hypothetical protein